MHIHIYGLHVRLTIQPYPQYLVSTKLCFEPSLAILRKPRLRPARTIAFAMLTHPRLSTAMLAARELPSELVHQTLNGAGEQWELLRRDATFQDFFDRVAEHSAQHQECPSGWTDTVEQGYLSHRDCLRKCHRWRRVPGFQPVSLSEQSAFLKHILVCSSIRRSSSTHRLPSLSLSCMDCFSALTRCLLDTC